MSELQKSCGHHTVTGLSILMPARFTIAGFFALLFMSPIARGQTQEWISIRGAKSAAEPVTAAAAQMKKDVGLDFTVATDGGSATAVSSIAEEVVDVALLNRPMTALEKAAYPNRNFVETRFGMQALLLVVPAQVWNSGVHALTKEQLRDVYEGKVKNWKALGGDDRKLVFFNRNISRSQWDLLMLYLYDDIRKAPLSQADVLEESSDVTTTVEFDSSAISFLDYYAPRTDRVHALGIKLPDGKIMDPTVANIAAGRYDISRGLFITTSRKPAGKTRRFVDFVLGPAGQEWVKKVGHIPNTELEKAKQADAESR